MIGPKLKRQPDRLICTECDALISKSLGGTKVFPKKRIVNYCQHENVGGGDPEIKVAFLKGFPYTPKWCPAKQEGTGGV